MIYRISLSFTEFELRFKRVRSGHTPHTVSKMQRYFSPTLILLIPTFLSLGLLLPKTSPGVLALFSAWTYQIPIVRDYFPHLGTS